MAGLGWQEMTAWLIAQAAPWVLGLMAVLGVYWRGHHNGKVAEAKAAMEKRAVEKAKALETRWDIDHAIDQDVDLVARAAASGVVRHTEH